MGQFVSKYDHYLKKVTFQNGKSCQFLKNKILSPHIIYNVYKSSSQVLTSHCWLLQRVEVIPASTYFQCASILAVSAVAAGSPPPQLNHWRMPKKG